MTKQSSSRGMTTAELARKHRTHPVDQARKEEREWFHAVRRAKARRLAE